MKRLASVLLLAVLLGGCKSGGGGGSTASGGGGSSITGCTLSASVAGVAKTMTTGCVCNYVSTALMFFMDTGVGTESITLSVNNPGVSAVRTASPASVEYSPDNSTTNYTSVNGGTFTITLNTYSGSTVGSGAAGTFSATAIQAASGATVDISSGTFSCQISAVF